jgi:hypothetical protein
MLIASSSNEYVIVPVQITIGGSPYNPTADTVQMAFVSGSAQPSSFSTASWTTTVQGTYYAKCLVGSAGTVLAPGLYTVWVKIQDSPEVPIRQAGTLQVT